MLRCHGALSLLLLALVGGTLAAQQPDPPPPAPVPSSAPPAATVVAATVNGVTIPELAVYRSLKGKAPADYKELRPEVVAFLVDNALVDQYLDQMKVSVDVKEVDVQFDKVKAEITQTQPFEKFCKSLYLTEADLRAQVLAATRWDKFIGQYAVEKTLREFHEANKAIFDGSQVRAKHILIQVGATPQEAEKAKATVAALKKQIEEKVAKGMADAGKLDNLEQQKLRMKLLSAAFAEVASKESTCPSKGSGGELGWFSRVGGKVMEPFVRAAFGLKPYEMSDVVVTELGYHLILVTDTRAGVDRKFEDIRDAVKEVYADRMREAIVARMRQTAKIEIAPSPK